MKLGTRDLASMAICAAAYCAGSLLTAYIPTPWVVQLRPAVVIPAVFAVLLGPLVGGVGAAVGTFIASIIRYGTPLLTIFSGTPANFACFYILGALSRPYSRKNFAVATITAFFVGSVIIGVGLWFLAAILGVELVSKFTQASVVFYSIGWTLCTEIPVVVALGIPIVEACRRLRLEGAESTEKNNQQY